MFEAFHKHQLWALPRKCQHTSAGSGSSRCLRLKENGNWWAWGSAFVELFGTIYTKQIYGKLVRSSTVSRSAPCRVSCAWKSVDQLCPICFQSKGSNHTLRCFEVGREIGWSWSDSFSNFSMGQATCWPINCIKFEPGFLGKTLGSCTRAKEFSAENQNLLFLVTVTLSADSKPCKVHQNQPSVPKWSRIKAVNMGPLLVSQCLHWIPKIGPLAQERGGHVGWPWGLRPWNRGWDFMNEAMEPMGLPSQPCQWLCFWQAIQIFIDAVNTAES